jgi:hypothetical protein
MPSQTPTQKTPADETSSAGAHPRMLSNTGALRAMARFVKPAIALKTIFTSAYYRVL